MFFPMVVFVILQDIVCDVALNYSNCFHVVLDDEVAFHVDVDKGFHRVVLIEVEQYGLEKIEEPGLK